MLLIWHLSELESVKTSMDIALSASASGSRKHKQSVTSPTVLFDEPKRSRRTRREQQSKRRKTARNGRPNSAASTEEFRFHIDQHGRQHFNFKQEIWLDAAVQMAHTRVYSTALKTLAVNLLTLTINRRDFRAAVGKTSRAAISLAPSFSRQCLIDAPDRAWIMPRATIEAWVHSKKRRRASGCEPSIACLS